LWFVVSPHNPLKKKKSLLDQSQRLHMVDLAIGDHDHIKSNNIEFSLPQPSYTINTLVSLQEKYPKHKFVLIMGLDNLKTFHKWKNYEEILKNYEVFVYPRPNSDGGALKDHEKITITSAPLIEISSTVIRKAIKEKKDIRYFLPKATWDYINDMHFYEK
jgi:nicotinate-nucleotide adenylyltransferase